MLEILGIKSAWQLLKIAVPIVLLLSTLGYIWYLRSENGTLTEQKLQLTGQLLQAVDANGSNLETINTLHKEAAETAALTEKNQKDTVGKDKTNDEAKHEISKRPDASEHVSPYIGNVFDRLRSIQQSEGTGQD